MDFVGLSAPQDQLRDNGSWNLYVNANQHRANPVPCTCAQHRDDNFRKTRFLPIKERGKGRRRGWKKTARSMEAKHGRFFSSGKNVERRGRLKNNIFAGSI